MIYIIRHGETEMNRKNVLLSRTDCPLSERGMEQVWEAAALLSGICFDRIYSSPLIRALQTARILVPDREPIIDERLIEMDSGPYEGMSLNDLPPEVVTFFADFVHNPAPKGMEPLEDVVKRAGRFMEECCRTTADILITTHAIAMKGILEYLTPDSHGSYWARYIGNCAVFRTEFRPDGTWTVPVEYKGECIG